MISQRPAEIPDVVRTAFLVLNVSGVSVTAYVLLQYAVRARFRRAYLLLSRR